MKILTSLALPHVLYEAHFINKAYRAERMLIPVIYQFCNSNINCLARQTAGGCRNAQPCTVDQRIFWPDEIGSVVNEDPQEAQSLMLPITMPIILSFIILSSTVGHPNTSIAFWSSMIPFTSPIVMMGRIANGVPEAVPWWQLFLSMALLIGGFVLTTWFAGKIYRTGILLYGKRVTWKEMIKWLRRSS